MIAPTINKYVWDILKSDPTLSAKYDKYRATYGANFIPFFPVYDNNAGDSSWGSECYVLYDSLRPRSNRPIVTEKREQILYTIVGTIPEIFEFRDTILNVLDFWADLKFTKDGFRVNAVESWQNDRTRGRDSIRQTYSLVLTVEVNYFEC